MKNIGLLSVIFLANTGTHSLAQNNITEWLEGNNVKVRFTSNGTLALKPGAFDGQGLNIPKDSELSTAVAGQVWIGALDQDNNLYVSAQAYNQSGYDFFYGPWMQQEFRQPEHYQGWNRAWVVRQSTVDSFEKGLFGAIPEVVLQWPGNGDPSRGQLAGLAPFRDRNQNGIYEPQKGEAPQVRGTNSMTILFNDVRSAHTEFNGVPLGLDLKLEAYVFDCNNPAFSETVFLRYELLNRSERTYKEFKLGLFMDFDIGDAMNDYVGIDTSMNGIYVRNFDPIDARYGQAAPSQGYFSLNRKPDAYFTYNNDASPNGNPSTAQHIYNYLKMPGVNHTATESADVRSVMTFYDQNVKPGDQLVYEFALVYGHEDGKDYKGNVEVMKERMRAVMVWRAKGVSPCGQPFEPTGLGLQFNEDIRVYPIPAIERIHVSGGQLSDQTRLQLLDQMGREVRNATGPEMDLSGLAAGVYFLHIKDGSKSASTRIIKQ